MKKLSSVINSFEKGAGCFAFALYLRWAHMSEDTVSLVSGRTVSFPTLMAVSVSESLYNKYCLFRFTINLFGARAKQGYSRRISIVRGLNNLLIYL